MNQNIINEVIDGVGWLTLNRPQKLNALSAEMIDELYKIVKDWKNNEDVKLVVLQGAGEKAFCAGGDVKHLYDQKDSDIHTVAQSFFDTEYRMNMILHTFGKPLIVYMNGIVMGGGVGLAVAGTHRIVTESTKWAMPEMNIGLYPDVGGSYFLSKMPNHFGRYLALTSNTIYAADVLATGTADYFMPSFKWLDLIKAIKGYKWQEVDVSTSINRIIESFCEPCPQASKLAAITKIIELCFDFESLEEIINCLQTASSYGSKWADETLKIVLTKSPTSLKVTLEQLIRGQKLPMKECFVMELEMSMNFMNSHDFFEGVRSVLIDRDRNPSWHPSTLDAITKDMVEGFFNYDWEDENPLVNFDF